MENASQLIPEVLKRTISDRVNADRAIAWIENSPERFNELTHAFDNVISRFNLLHNVPKELINTLSIKLTLGRKRLPAIREMRSGGMGSLKDFMSTMKNADVLMHRGETTKEKPYLSFHIADVDDETLVIGGIIHIYEEAIVNDSKLSSHVLRDVFLDSLVEVISLDRQSPLYDAVASEGRLNWIKGWTGFTPGFRAENGFPDFAS